MSEAAFHALADPRRRAILRLVRDRPRSVNEIAEKFDITQQAISLHLKVLRDAGLVAVRPPGQRRLYAVRPEGLAALRDFLAEFCPSSYSSLSRPWNPVIRLRRPAMAADAVAASVHIDAPPERVYEYFTRPEAIVSWMGEYALLEAEPGGRFVLDIKGTPVRGRFLELDPPRRLVISWGYAGSDHLPPGASTVEVRLTADRGGTRVELQHRDLPPGERPGHASGWTHYLARLEHAASGRHPGPDPGMPQALLA